MLFAMLCSLRQREARSAKRLSKNWTAVVMMTGASQFSVAWRSLSRLSRSRSVLSSKVHGQGKEAGRERCLLLCVLEDFAAQAVQFGLAAFAVLCFGAGVL